MDLEWFTRGVGRLDLSMELSVWATRFCGAFRIGGADTAEGEGRERR